MITGIPASPGIVFGKALVLKEEKRKITIFFEKKKYRLYKKEKNKK